jgi:hypothetical protein
LGVHPNCTLFRGSTKLGFSIAPQLDKVWMKYGAASDLDLSIIDERLFSRIDHEIRHWERRSDNRSRLFRDERLLASWKRRINQRGRYGCFRHFDLPRDIPIMLEIDECLRCAPVKAACGIDRPLTVFIFRDWWGVYERYDANLHELCKELRRPEFPQGGDHRRSRQEES